MDEKKVWEILGIEKTADENIIKDAYRQALLHTNPEDDPEGFKKLREAYERAVYIAAHGDEKEEEKEVTPVGMLMEKAGEIYADVKTRRNLSLWEEWADDPLIQGLDTVDSVRHEFLIFCMEHFHFPTDVWQFFDRVFRICDEAATLSETFPENFIRFIVSHVTEEDYFTYDDVIERSELDFAPVMEIPIEAEMDYTDEGEIPETDKYIRNVSGLYHIYGGLQNKYTPEDSIPKLLDELAARIICLRKSDIYHPFEMIGLLRYLDFTDRNEEGLPVALHFLTPESIDRWDNYSLANMAFFIVKTYFKRENADMDEIAFVMDAFDKVLSNEPHYVLANYGKSIYHFIQGDYVNADEEVLLAVEFNDQNKNIENFVDVVDEKLLKYYEDRMAENPDDIKAAVEAGWCYLRKGDTEKTLEILNNTTPDEENEYSYYNLYARYFVREENFKDAEPHLLKWQEYLLDIYEKMQKESEEALTDVEKKRLERLGYSYYLLALCKKDNGDSDGALALMDTAIETSTREDERVRYTHIKGQMLHDFGRYDEAIELWNGMIEEMPDYTPAYIFRQEASFNERNAQQVIDDFWNITEMMPEYKDAYVYAAKVYNIYERGDLFDEMLQVAERNGIDSMALTFEKGKRFLIERNYEAAEDIFRKLYSEIDSEECDIKDKSEFYTEYGVTLFNLSRDPENADEKDSMLEFALMISGKAIEENNNSRRAHWIKTDVLEAMEKDAIPEYENMIQIFSDDPDVFYEYGLYLERMGRERDAIEYYKKTVQIYDGHRSAHGKLSDHYLEEFLDSESKDDYQAAVDHAEKQLRNYSSAYYYVAEGLVYIEGNEFEKALEAGTRAAEEEPDDVYAYNVIGYSLMMLKRYDEAEEAFNKGNELLKEQPKKTALQRNYIKFLEMNGRYAEAIDYAKAYFKQFDLSSTDTHGTLASLYKKNRDYENALKEYAIIQKIYQRRATGSEPDRDYIGVNDIRGHYLNTDLEFMSYIVSNQVKVIETCFVMGKMDEYNKAYTDLVKYIKHENFKVKYKLFKGDEEQKKKALYISAIYRDIGRHELFVRRDYNAAVKYMENAVYFKELSIRKNNFQTHMFGKTKLELAEAYMRAGRSKDASEMAEKSIQDLIYPNKTIEEYLSYPNERPYRYGEIAKYFFYTGFPAKAAPLLEKMHEFPFCNFCRQKECYDRFLTEGNFYEISGNKTKALECYLHAMEMCDDDAELNAAIDELSSED